MSVTLTKIKAENYGHSFIVSLQKNENNELSLRIEPEKEDYNEAAMCLYDQVAESPVLEFELKGVTVMPSFDGSPALVYEAKDV